jgi:NADPH:quinone reductase-like Zn-dependent oxidoreductase
VQRRRDGGKEQDMQALVFEKKGDLSSLGARDVPAPEPDPGEVVVVVHAAGLNPSDVKNVEGAFAYTTVPRIPGRDFSGIVVKGPAALLGAAVWGTGKEIGFTRDGAHAEYVALPRAGVARKPEVLSFEQAAAVGVPYTTAWSALERCAVVAGTRVVVVGALGAVGRAAVDLAFWRGANVVGAVRRHEHRAAMETRGFGSIHVVNPAALPDLVHDVFHGGADVIFDTTGAYLEHAIAALAPEGRIAVIAPPAGGHIPLPVVELYRRGGVIVGVNSLLYDSVACAKVLERIGAGFEQGRLTVPDAFTVRPFEEALSVYREVKAGSVGKQVFVMPIGA